MINLIVKDILPALKSGNTEEATSSCDTLDEGKRHLCDTLEPLGKLRILALWIHRSPQRRQTWNSSCKRMNLSDKFIDYDVDTRWNSISRVLSDALKSRTQLEEFVHYETDFLPF
ncbi:hypothetical protein BGW36DRAFT_433992 [Talaromyces proteolyticus]|uniref:Uncharacterized protein n=1 Tax=Talaromyces proteolyticus TaxID=1131652 RepID=A0AAD4KEY9_9EURO|nr:uncharacterized protein BGW36DRAFT_433992 [Talaromyces proteolyticus]KAH8688693.1 hypothetical protein BGW36DRAFT_433992 [Talaromyces proteolyticus]